MARPFQLIFLFFLAVNVSFGQAKEELIKMISSKSFITFNHRADSLNNAKKGIEVYSEYLRDLTPEYKEGIYKVVESFERKNRPLSDSISSYSIKLITSDTEIIFFSVYDYSQKAICLEFKDSASYSLLKAQFKKLYSSELNEKELFLTNLIYANTCGITGEKPMERIQINNWVATKNKRELLLWLKSTHTEKQIYAADGLLQLKKAGVRLTKKEINILKIVCNKKGTIFFCGGCFYSRKCPVLK